MNFVDFRIDCYSHITSHISQTFASCAYYTSYSLLSFVHVIVCVSGLTNQVLQILWILCKINLLLENLWRIQEILSLGNLGLIFFWKSHHHILMHFVLKFQCFEFILNFFQKTVFFLKFSEPLPISIEPFYFSINQNFFKYVWESLWLFRSIETDFRSIELFSICFVKVSVCFDRSRMFFDRSKLVNHVFFKSQIGLFQCHFFKPFQTFLSLSDLARLH